MKTNVAFINTQSGIKLTHGNGVFVGNKLLTAAHVIEKTDGFIAEGESYDNSSVICRMKTDYWYKQTFCVLTLKRFGWNYDDFSLFESKNRQSSLILSPTLPSMNELLYSYSYKNVVEKSTLENVSDIFSTQQRLAFFEDKAKVLYIRGNYIFCEMDGMLEKGRSGCPLIKDNKVYGILRGGDDKKICWFQSSVSILKRLTDHGISI